MLVEKGIAMTLEVAFKFIIGTVIGYIMYKFKRLEEKAERSVDAAQARQLIDDKIEPLRVKVENLDDRLDRMEGKIDRIIDKL